MGNGKGKHRTAPIPREIRPRVPAPVPDEITTRAPTEPISHIPRPTYSSKPKGIDPSVTAATKQQITLLQRKKDYLKQKTTSFEGFSGAIDRAFMADRSALVKAWQTNNIRNIRNYKPILSRIEQIASKHIEALRTLEKFKGTNTYWSARQELKSLFELFVGHKTSTITYDKIQASYQAFIDRYRRLQPTIRQ